MDLEALKRRFFELIAPDLPNEWDVEEAVETLVDEPMIESILAQVPVIWPVSNSLCYNYLGQVQKALQCIDASELPAWVNETLDHYETGGLRAAQMFMIDVEENYICRLRGESGVRLSEVEGWLLPYVQGLAGKKLEFSIADSAATDTGTIFLPVELVRFSGEESNTLLYKLMVSYQWAFIHLQSFFPEISRDSSLFGRENGLESFFGSFDNQGLASRLYHTLETLRAGFFLQKELPGLMRATVDIRRELAPESGTDESEPSVLSILDRECCLLSSVADANTAWWYGDVLLRMRADDSSVQTSLDLCRSLYERIAGETEGGVVPEPLIFQGELRLQDLYERRRKQQALLEEEFVEAFSTFILQLPQASEVIKEQQEATSGGGESEGEHAVIFEQQQSDRQTADETVYLRIDNESVELSQELQQMVREMETGLGMDPSRYISSAMGRAGQHMAEGDFEPAADQQVCVAQVSYDEWDFRRNGFRKNWCILSEQEIPPVRSTFVPTTLEKYRGQILRLRHQFEMMRTQERFLRRQRDGDDIDFDALVESIADTRAGLAPSDRLFIRLQRDERDIAAFFLVDMSNSTEGWVGAAIKESLVLICEAMEVLGDRYAIYGFSGMRRLRCETFHVKHIDEPYSEEVRQRIGAIGPREYTRMGPAIRHMTSIFQGIDARIRLLITLSDGKPEDYDDYKGEYAIEDTRHALLEAKSAGIHPFCITIDRHAHDYMAHMYGEVNYIFINDVRKLPARMPEIYRVLTS